MTYRLSCRAFHERAKTLQPQQPGKVFGDDSYRHSLCFVSCCGGGATPKEVS